MIAALRRRQRRMAFDRHPRLEGVVAERNAVRRPATCCTPGNAFDVVRRFRSKNCARGPARDVFAQAASFGSDTVISAVSRWSGVNPRSTCCSFQKLRTISPAPASSTTDIASSSTTSALRARRPPAPVVAARPPARSTSESGVLAPIDAGSSRRAPPRTSNRRARTAARASRRRSRLGAAGPPERARESRRRSPHASTAPIDPADQREQKVLDQQARERAATSRADRGAHGDLRPSRGTAREQQARHVRARDEQHEAHRAEQQYERPTAVARHHVIDASARDLPASSVGVPAMP